MPRSLRARRFSTINTDGNGRGFLGAEGSHDLQHLVNAVARDVTDPQTSTSVLERLQAKVRADAYDGSAGRDQDAVALAAANSGSDMPIGALGSGSDYSAFLQHFGHPPRSTSVLVEKAAEAGRTTRSTIASTM